MRRARPMLGTLVEIQAHGDDSDPAIEAAFGAIRRVEVLMSFHDRKSELSRLNREAHRRAVQVDPWTAEVLTLVREIHAASEGLFDIAVAPVLMRWGLLPRRYRRNGGSTADIDIDATGHVRFARPLAIDLGGIAKGYAVDRAADALQRLGIRDFVINAGGDIRIGKRATALVVRDPSQPWKTVPLCDLANGAAATSAPYFSARQVEGHTVSSIVNPFAGGPPATPRSVTVFADQCAVADALTKVVAIAGSAELPVLRRFGARCVILEANALEPA